MRRDPVSEPLWPDTLFDPCIKCTICTTVCPVVKVTGEFPGPKQAGPDAQRFRGRGETVEGPWINLCTGCYRCQIACPADVPIAEINLFAKQRYARERGRDVATHLLTHAHLVALWSHRLRWLARPMLRMGWSRRLAEMIFGIDRQAPMPPIARRRFSSLAREYRPKPGRRKVAYFHGCYTDNNEPAIGQAVLAVLEAAGIETLIPDQACCGAALFGAGNFAAARRQNERNISSFRAAIKLGCEAIVVGSPSCALALSHELGDVLGMEDADVYERVIDLFTYLERLDAAGQLSLNLRETPITAAYHEACHLTALGRGANAPRLLNKIPGLRVRMLDAGCCGLAGTFGLKHKTANLARAIGQGPARLIGEWRPEWVLSECEGCRMQLSHLTGVPARHPIEILAQALIK